MKIYQVFIWGVLSLLLFSQAVDAVGIAINPGGVNFNNMLKGGYAERTFRVSTSSGQKVNVDIEFDSSTPDINEWITLVPDQTNFNITNSQDKRMKLIVEPPEDTPNGRYETYLHFTAIPPNVSTEGRTVAIVQTAVAMQIVININDYEISSCNVMRSGIGDVERGEPVPLNFEIYNSGNVLNEPEIEVDIWDKSQSKILNTYSYSPVTILPTTSESFSVNFSSDQYDEDQFFAEIKVPDCDKFSDVKTFDILEPGTISASGKLMHIKNEAWHNVGDTVQIVPEFHNDGDHKVTAEFQGYVFRDDKLIDVLDSESLEVSPGETMEFPFYYVPEDVGRYQVKGRVFYDKKRTFEVTSRFNVNPEEESDRATGQVVTDINKGEKPSPLYFFIILGAIGFLFVMIQKKKAKIRKHRY